VFDRVTELELIHLENLYHESTLHMDVMLDELSINETTSFNHIHHFQYLDIMSQIEAIEKLDILSSRVITCLNEKNHTYYRYKLLIECYHRLPFNQQEKAKIHDIITRMPDKKAYKLLKHQFKSYHLKQSELKIFLKEEALPDAITMNQLYYIKYFTDQLIDISIDNHRYKEGLYHQKKFKRILKKLQSFY
jgi:hypothetical protein